MSRSCGDCGRGLHGSETTCRMCGWVEPKPEGLREPLDGPACTKCGHAALMQREGDVLCRDCYAKANPGRLSDIEKRVQAEFPREPEPPYTNWARRIVRLEELGIAQPFASLVAARKVLEDRPAVIPEAPEEQRGDAWEA